MVLIIGLIYLSQSRMHCTWALSQSSGTVGHR